MRILQVLSSLNKNSGIANVVMNWYRHIDRDAIQFDFLIFYSPENNYEEEVKEMGANVYYIEKPTLKTYFDYRKKVKTFFRDNGNKYAAIHSHEIILSGIVFKYAAKYSAAQKILHSHSTVYSDTVLKSIRNRILSAKGKRLADKKLACGKLSGEKIFGRYSDFEVLLNTIDRERLDAKPQNTPEELRAQFNISTDSYVIGSVGRLSKIKNQKFLIDLLTMLDKKCVVFFVGDGELKDYLKAYAQKKSVGDRVIFAGTRTDLKNIMQIFNVFAFPSLHEGLPLAVVEAQYFGVPVICSDRITEECCLYDGIRYPLKLSSWKDAVTNVCVPNISSQAYEAFDVDNVLARLVEIYK